MALMLRCFLLTICTIFIEAVDKNNFKTCDQSSFCRRLRSIKPGDSKYELDLSSFQVSDHSVESVLVNTEAGIQLKWFLKAVVGNIFHIQIDEASPLYQRYRPQLALNEEIQVAKLEIINRNEETVTVRCAHNRAVIQARPFRIEFFNEDALVSVVNSRGLFTFEHYRKKADGEEAHAQEDPGSWEENFKSHHDSKPRGPSAIGLDISFPGALRAYGLPEHADKSLSQLKSNIPHELRIKLRHKARDTFEKITFFLKKCSINRVVKRLGCQEIPQLALRTTGQGGLDPYRLYNLDVFEYELDSTMAIYGAVPVVYAHSLHRTVGAFWHNAAETWVDINNSKDGNVMSSLVNLVSGSKSENNVDVHFMSESGIVDLFILMGPTPRDTVRQYASLTGVAPLPQYFTLAYHQCRWNYNDEDDVTSVVNNFDYHDMPVDIMWLDIEYTDGKKYFTWDPIKFPHPDVMINNLTSTGRKLVVIIDPHIKRESGYFLHEDALANDYYVKTKDGNVYEGWCWPGSSSYLDFYDPKTVDYYKGLYGVDKFKGTTNDVYIWNDMNEPSVFNGPEITMPKDCLHHGGWEHRDVHNEYPLAHATATFEGLIKRSSNRRPFILTRGHFAGSQRVAAVWTGDNAAEWSHLAVSYPMCLSEALGGISFCGADIGGFFNNPDVELLQRWYQAGIWLPFFRAHAHIDTRRREPYLFNEDVRNRIRTALKLRYAHLPLWYTLFWEHEMTGDPVIAPLFYNYPSDANSLDIDNEVLVGKSVLARAISDPGATTVDVYLPGGQDEYWYDIEDFKLYRGTGSYNIPVSLDKILAFYRGGTIIPRKDRPRRASSLMHNDPFTLYVALDNKKTASGTLFVDDNESFEYRNKKYIYINYTFEDNTLRSSSIDKTDYPTKEWIERVIILGPPSGVAGAKLVSKSIGTVDLQTSYGNEERSLIIRKPGVSIREYFTIKLY